MMGKHLAFKENDRVRISSPNNRYDGKAGVIVEIDENDLHHLCYNVRLDSASSDIPFWLPETMLRHYDKKTLQELIPGDHLKNSAHLEYEVLEPLSPVYFVRPLGSPVIQYISAEELERMGFTVVDKES